MWWWVTPLLWHTAQLLMSLRQWIINLRKVWSECVCAVMQLSGDFQGEVKPQTLPAFVVCVFVITIQTNLFLFVSRFAAYMHRFILERYLGSEHFWSVFKCSFTQCVCVFIFVISCSSDTKAGVDVFYHHLSSRAETNSRLTENELTIIWFVQFWFAVCVQPLTVCRLWFITLSHVINIDSYSSYISLYANCLC